MLRSHFLFFAGEQRGGGWSRCIEFNRLSPDAVVEHE